LLGQKRQPERSLNLYDIFIDMFYTLRSIGSGEAVLNQVQR
jgi:hypothetical protein